MCGTRLTVESLHRFIFILSVIWRSLVCIPQRMDVISRCSNRLRAEHRKGNPFDWTIEETRKVEKEIEPFRFAVTLLHLFHGLELEPGSIQCIDPITLWPFP